jgi:hypothetical protein
MQRKANRRWPRRVGKRTKRGAVSASIGMQRGCAYARGVGLMSVACMCDRIQSKRQQQGHKRDANRAGRVPGNLEEVHDTTLNARYCGCKSSRRCFPRTKVKFGGPVRGCRV